MDSSEALGIPASTSIGARVVTLVHGDDYTTAGNVKELRWLKKMLEDTYEIKTQIIGPEGDKIG